MLCQKCGETHDVRVITVTDLQDSPPGSETWALCLRCLLYKGYWCSYHECVKHILLDPSSPSADLPYAIRLACVECCREKTVQLDEGAARHAVGLIERSRPDLYTWLGMQGDEAGLPADASEAKRLAFGLVLTAEFYRLPLDRTVAQLAGQGRAATSHAIH